MIDHKNALSWLNFKNQNLDQSQQDSRTPRAASISSFHTSFIKEADFCKKIIIYPVVKSK